MASTVAIFAITILGSALIEAVVINRFRKHAVNLKTFPPLLLLVNAVSGGITVAVFLYWA